MLYPSFRKICEKMYLTQEVQCFILHLIRFAKKCAWRKEYNVSFFISYNLRTNVPDARSAMFYSSSHTIREKLCLAQGVQCLIYYGTLFSSFEPEWSSR